MQVLIFCLLKIFELCLVIFIPYYAGLLVEKLEKDWEYSSNKIATWFRGIAGMSVAVACCLLLFLVGALLWDLVTKGIPELIDANWYWAEQITQLMSRYSK